MYQAIVARFSIRLWYLGRRYSTFMLDANPDVRSVPWEIVYMRQI
jgi:hypothetical protein